MKLIETPWKKTQPHQGEKDFNSTISATEDAPSFALLEQPSRYSSSTRKAIWAIVVFLVIFAIAVPVTYWAIKMRPPTPLPTADIPTLSPAEGTFSGAVKVAIADSTPNSTIHYTLDGNQPTAASPTYTTPITVSTSGTSIRAIAVADGHQVSPVISGLFVILEAAKPTADAEAVSDFDKGKASYDQKDYQQARISFSPACDAGDMKACSYLGLLYGQGLGGDQNIDLALAAYTKACEKDILSSCTSMGSLLQDSGKIDEARHYFQIACQGGYSDACTLQEQAR